MQQVNNLDNLDFVLPDDLIAKQPQKEKSASRLLFLNKKKA